MTTGARDQTETAADAWRAVRDDDSIQFAPVEQPEPPEQPEWLREFFAWLADVMEPVGRLFGSAWPIVKWVLLALAVLGTLLVVWRVVEPLFARSPRAQGKPEDWAPSRGEAIALLEDADRLAAAGKFDEATHLLLQRSVGQIAAARPDWVEPSSTARELAALPALPGDARRAFGTIARAVERSVFALRSLDRDDWQMARDAYAEFALQKLPAHGA